MRRRGSIALVAVALVTLACGQARTSGEPLPTPEASGTPIPSLASGPSATADPATTASDSPRPEHGTWQAAAPMTRERYGFDAVALGDGTVLAVGSDWGCQPGGAVAGSETAEVYDPAADTWSEIASLNKPRKEPATVVLSDGTALVIGGLNSEDVAFSSTKILDPRSRAWTDGPLLEYARLQPRAVHLDDGRVLVVSATGGEYDATAELSDGGRTRWSSVRSLPARFTVQDLVALDHGRALAVIIHHRDSDPAPVTSIYDAERDTWTEGEGLARFDATYLTLPDGSVLAIGGAGGGELWNDTRAVVEDVARFDPATGRWTPVAPLVTPRRGTQAAVLANGTVLVAGGTSVGSSGERRTLRSTELYDPETDAWSPAGDLLEPRYDAQMVALDDGSALILGGTAEHNVDGDTPFCPQPLTTTERFRP
ncbi:MAG TPA: hypothetical protein VF119_01290 [Candidatus Limnocylindrales bacterium]